MMMNVGVVGGGQLGRMMGAAAKGMGGVTMRVLTPDRGASALAHASPVFGDLTDREALARLAKASDVVTVETENVPVDLLTPFRQKVMPPLSAIAASQDRLDEKRLFNELGVPTNRFVPVNDTDALARAVAKLGERVVVKTRRMGYDGKGQVVVGRGAGTLADAARLLSQGSLLVEAWVPFVRELSLVAARSRRGDVVFYPLVHNEHREGILRRTTAPAQGVGEALAAEARSHVKRIMERFDYVGVFTLELFDTGDGLLANEMAPRVHNSGHWTIECAATSQFENHLRAICGMNLGATEVLCPCVMDNVIGAVPERFQEGAFVHLYDKEPRPGRKLGHVTTRVEHV